MLRLDGGIRPAHYVVAAASLLEGGLTQSDLARSLLEREVEEVLEILVFDEDVAHQRSIRVRISFLAPRGEYASCPSFRHAGESVVLRRIPARRIA
jgi:hypothetical protein